MDDGWQRSWRAALLSQASLVWGAGDIDAVQWVETGEIRKAKASKIHDTFDETIAKNVASLQAKWHQEGKVTVWTGEPIEVTHGQ